jgi:uncharacterized peroxidase-related enzyme
MVKAASPSAKKRKALTETQTFLTKEEAKMAVPKPITREEAAADLHGIYDNLTEAFGIMPNFFGVMARRPHVLKTLLPFFDAVMSQCTLDAKLKELASVKTSMVNGCEYCGRAHLAWAKQAGATPEQVKALDFYQRSDAFDEKEKAVIRYADNVSRGPAGMTPQSLEELQRFFTNDEIVDLTLVICLVNFTNLFNDALQVIPDLG